MEIYIQMRKTALYLMISSYSKNMTCIWLKEKSCKHCRWSLWTNTNQVAFIQLNLQVLYRLFKYAFCVSERVYGIVLEPLFGIVLCHIQEVCHTYTKACVELSVGEATRERQCVGALHALSSESREWVVMSLFPLLPQQALVSLVFYQCILHMHFFVPTLEFELVPPLSVNSAHSSDLNLAVITEGKLWAAFSSYSLLHIYSLCHSWPSFSFVMIWCSFLSQDCRLHEGRVYVCCIHQHIIFP